MINLTNQGEDDLKGSKQLSQPGTPSACLLEGLTRLWLGSTFGVDSVSGIQGKVSLTLNAKIRAKTVLAVVLCVPVEAVSNPVWEWTAAGKCSFRDE